MKRLMDWAAYRVLASVLVFVMVVVLGTQLYAATAPIVHEAVGFATSKRTPAPRPDVLRLECLKFTEGANALAASKDVARFQCTVSPPNLAPAEAASSGAAGAAAFAASSPSVDSSINLIAIVIALVTLILTIGTSWFTQKQVELQKYADDTEAMRDLAELLVAARINMIRGLGSKFGQAFAATDGQILGSILELLLSSRPEQRQLAYLELKAYFGPGQRGSFPDLALYVAVCSRRVPVGQESWCGIFDDD